MTRQTGRLINSQQLRQLIAAKLWNLSDLSRASNVSYRAVKNAVSGGHKVNLRTAQAFADALKCDVDDFSTLVGPGAQVSA